MTRRPINYAMLAAAIVDVACWLLLVLGAYAVLRRWP